MPLDLDAVMMYALKRPTHVVVYKTLIRGLISRSSRTTQPSHPYVNNSGLKHDTGHYTDRWSTGLDWYDMISVLNFKPQDEPENEV